MTKLNTKIRKCSKCKEVKTVEKLLNYSCYCRSCYREYQSNYYRDKVVSGEYVYLIWNAEGQAIYIGSTNNKYRLLKHIKSNTHLNLNEQDWYDLELLNCTYAKVSDIILNENERRYLENLYVRLYNPLLNGINEEVELDADREEEINYYFEKQFVNFTNIEIDRKKLQLGKVEVKELIFK